MDNRKKIDNIVAVLIPILLLLFAKFHNFPILILAYLLALAYILKPFVLFPATFITSLSTNYFVIVPGISNGLVFTVLFIMSLIIKTIRSDASFVNVPIVIWILILLLYNLLKSVFSITGGFSTFIIMAENLILLFLLSIQKDINLDNLAKTLATASLFTVFILFWNYLSGSMIETYGGRLTTEGENENGFAIMLSQLGTVVVFSFFYFRQNGVFRILMLVGFLISIYLLILSGSRSAFFGSLSGLSLVLILYVLYNKERKKTVFPILLLVIMLFVGGNKLLDSDLMVLERFKMENIVEGRGTSRLDRMHFLIKNVFPEKPFFGIGLGGENEYAISPGPCHNIIIDPLIQTGLVGLILYWGFIIPLIKSPIRILRSNHFIMALPLALFLVCFVNGMGEVIFFEKFFWNSIAMCVLFTNNYPMHTTLLYTNKDE